MDDTLFALPPTERSEPEELAPGTPRLQRPNRGQLELRSVYPGGEPSVRCPSGQ